MFWNKLGVRRMRDHSRNSNQSLTMVSGSPNVALKRVREVRDQCKKLSDSYFANLEDFIRKKMAKITSEQSDLLL